MMPVTKLVYALLLLSSSCILSFTVSAQQNAAVIGSVRDKETQEVLEGVVVALDGTGYGTRSDSAGFYKLESLPPGTYIVVAQYPGYKAIKLYNIVLNNGNTNTLNIELEKNEQLNEVVVRNNSYGKRIETPLSVQSLTTEEIKSNPGGNFDISRVIQALPGVGGTSGGAARNDLIIRGGAPNENVYYLDGIEVPQINHFSTQGASGGAQGILNVSFINDVSLSSSSFAARYDNALSSVLQFKQRDGNPEKLQGNARLSSTEVALTAEGPLSKKTTFLVSARRSYLQYFFQLIDLPIRPNYWDFQYKLTHKLNSKTTITAIGLGAIDKFSFAVPKQTDLEKEYIIRSLPTVNQWSYVVGVSLKKLISKGYYSLNVSRNTFNNRLDQFEDASFGDESKRNYKSVSTETENKLRFEVNKFYSKWKLSYGASAQYAQFNNDLYAVIRKEVRDTGGNVIQPSVKATYNSEIGFLKYGVFVSANRKFFSQKLSVNIGLRTDMNQYLDDGNNPLNAMSPRLALSYAVTDKVNLNATVGRYAKLPVYTVLGYRDSLGELVNRSNKYILCDHYVAGLEYLPANSLRVTLEGFYKQYSNYPVSLRDGISLANLGANFGSIGNEQVASVGKGRAYGAELFIQKKLVKNFFLTASYTLFVSEFTGLNGQYTASSWDTRHLVSLILGYKLKKGWEFGAKYRLSGGTPYTPFDLTASQFNYQTIGQGVPDYSRINQERLPAFNQLDIRIDKKFNFKKTALDVYLDFQNAAFSKNVNQDYYTFKRNEDNSYATTDNKPLKVDGSNAIPVLIKNIDQTVTPSIGIIFEF